MTFSRYLTSSIGEFALLLVSAGCLALVAENAFFLESAPAKPLVTFTACAVLAAVLFCAAYRRERRLALSVLYVAIVGVLVGASLAFSTGDAPYEDAEGNYLYLALVISCAATAAFLLTRTLAGSIAWFLACAFICSVVQAFYEVEAIVPSLAAVTAALALAIYRNFRINVLKADVARESAGLGMASLAASAAPAAIACASALVLWFAVIAPLSPGVLEVKLITEYRQLPIVELRGVADEKPIMNLEMTSDDLVDGFRYTTDDLVQDDFAEDTVDGEQYFEQLLMGGGSAEQGAGNESGEDGGLDPDSTDDEYNALSYTQIPPIVLAAIVALCVLAIAVTLAVLARQWLRRRKLERMLGQEPRQQVMSIYRFLLERLGRLGIDVPAGMTLSEFSASSAARTEPFGREAGVRFDELTHIFEQCAYGGHEPDEDEIVPFVAWYLAFWRAARNQLGTAKYLLRSLRL